ncbi:MAG TPA: DUF3416 domain-containing protein [bacterium]|nr:DUF3416 domain-containing protein [bacterium]HPN30724.1 DUF3416 domain-containing protein [bacterium]
MEKLSVMIENVYPELDGGRYPVKRETGDWFEVTADIFQEGHESPEAVLKHRKKGESKWSESPMKFIDNDMWRGGFNLPETGIYEYTISAWPEKNKEIVSNYDRILEVKVDPVIARYAAWYGMWPRSQGTIPNQSATFKDMENRLKEIHWMGFDVVYLTPIHPIGKTHRKGANNALVAKPGEPGCPYAIGNELGGHCAIEPGLGTVEDFKHFVSEAKKYNMEVALDIAHTCSPDHPYAKEHPDWFYREPDGKIKCAENPPKRYEDIYPFNFYSEDWKNLWEELKQIFIFWIKLGVKIFRIDNPHTKPFAFWNWIISEVQKEYPDAVFLSEAFTRPKVMKALCKSGFTQTYTYFTWRNFKQEITDYFSEITTPPVSEYLRGNLFTNTPDILSEILQYGGRPAFKLRAALAATLSSLWGLYNGFELCENKAVPGKEEYADSEKYQYKVWDWDRPGNIKEFIRKLNMIRKENPALHYYKNLKFYRADNDNIIFYGKTSPDMSNTVLTAVNLDPYHTHEAGLFIPIYELGIKPDQTFILYNLITGERTMTRGEYFRIKLEPNNEPALIFKLERWASRENNFDYYL